MFYREVIRFDKDIIKFCVVYDVFVKCGGLSFNDCLYFGLFFIFMIFDVMVWFRVYKVVFIVDIEKVFLNVVIVFEYCDYLWFFWVDDIFIDNL